MADYNGRPSVALEQERTVTKSITTNASNTTATVNLFTLTGTVEVTAIWGVITTVLSSNHTAAYLQMNDQTTTPDITLATGVTLSSKTAGCLLVKKGLTAVALILLDNAAGVFSEPTTAETTFHSPFVVGKKTAAATTIDYTYSTTNTPATGAIKWYVRYKPLTDDGLLTPA